jgi:hypothetical protein
MAETLTSRDGLLEAADQVQIALILTKLSAAGVKAARAAVETAQTESLKMVLAQTVNITFLEKIIPVVAVAVAETFLTPHGIMFFTVLVAATLAALVEVE